ncbi:MAG: DUF1801 domain-containing protein [Planctomycetales bacterium]|nr:DUF1801 domain-containing protein [Planctomycetales bacterium]
MSKKKPAKPPGIAKAKATDKGAEKSGDKFSNTVSHESDSKSIDAQIMALSDWRGEVLARIRDFIQQAVPDVIEEVKWRKPSNSMLGVPVWSHHGIICTGETYKDKVKLTFPRGASLDDPVGLFNSSLDGNTRRAIDIYAQSNIDARAFKSLIKAAANLNQRKNT